MTNNLFTKLISVRVENETLKAIDNYLVTRKYLKRSAVINMALRQLFVNCTEEQIYDFLWSNKYVQPCDTNH